jgi:hypothetical protein
VMKKAQYFITCNELAALNTVSDTSPEYVRSLLVPRKKGRKQPDLQQTSLIFPE